MRVLGVGLDLVDVGRFSRLLDSGGRRFLNRWFRTTEVQWLLDQEGTSRHTAALFAAKEAVLKSLGAPGPGPLRWREIEIVQGDSRVSVQFHASVRMLAEQSRVIRCEASLMPGSRVASAVALAFGDHGGSVDALPLRDLVDLTEEIALLHEVCMRSDR